MEKKRNHDLKERASTLRDMFKRVRGLKILIVLIVLVAFFSIASDEFLSLANMINIARQISLITIVGMGITICLISGSFDLSIGANVAVTGLFCAMLFAKFGFPIWIAIILAICLGGLIGLINGIISTIINIPPLLATLGMMITLRGVALLMNNGQSIVNLPEEFQVIGRGFIGPLPIPVIIMIIIIFIFLFIQQKTTFPLYYYAIGGNKVAARLAGINIEKYTIIVLVIVGVLAGLGGVITASRLGIATPLAGTGFEFDVIIAVVVGGASIMGGRGNIQGTILGAMIMGVLTNGMIMVNLQSFYQDVVKGLLLIVAVGSETFLQRRASK